MIRELGLHRFQTFVRYQLAPRLQGTAGASLGAKGHIALLAIVIPTMLYDTMGQVCKGIAKMHCAAFQLILRVLTIHFSAAATATYDYHYSVPLLPSTASGQFLGYTITHQQRQRLWYTWHLHDRLLVRTWRPSVPTRPRGMEGPCSRRLPAHVRFNLRKFLDIPRYRKLYCDIPCHYMLTSSYRWCFNK